MYYGASFTRRIERAFRIRCSKWEKSEGFNRMARMNSASRHTVAMGAILMLLGVLLGAFGAHALKTRLSAEMLAVYQTGVQYHLLHALGLMVLGIMRQLYAGETLLRASAWLMGVGVVLFSGSLYALAITGITMLGALTPIGGLCFLTAWALVVRVMLREN